MNVLHLYSGNLYGGVETFLVTLARNSNLVPETHHHFALCFEGRLQRELLEAGAKVIQLSPIRLRQPLSVLRARRALKALLNSAVRFDVIICHSSWPQAIFGSVVKHSGIPHIFYIHGPVVKLEWPDRLARRVVPDLMIAVSRDTLNSGRQLYPRVRAEVLNYPIPWNMVAAENPEDSARLREQFDVAPSTVLISQISRMDRWKGHDLHLRALALLMDLPNWTCWIAGGAQRAHEIIFRNELEKLTDELGLRSRVRFLGERRDVPALLSATDIYCQANRGPEGFSLAFMEAFTAGCPIVTTNMGGAAELIDEHTGILTPPSDITALSGALRRLILDPDLRAQLGKAAKKRVAKVSDPQQQIARLSEILSETIRSCQGRNVR